MAEKSLGKILGLKVLKHMCNLTFLASLAFSGKSLVGVYKARPDPDPAVRVGKSTGEVKCSSWLLYIYAGLSQVTYLINYYKYIMGFD